MYPPRADDGRVAAPRDGDDDDDVGDNDDDDAAASSSSEARRGSGRVTDENSASQGFADGVYGGDDGRGLVMDE